jgi:hypothetical protein
VLGFLAWDKINMVEKLMTHTKDKIAPFSLGKLKPFSQEIFFEVVLVLNACAIEGVAGDVSDKEGLISGFTPLMLYIFIFFKVLFEYIGYLQAKNVFESFFSSTFYFFCQFPKSTQIFDGLYTYPKLFLIVGFTYLHPQYLNFKFLYDQTFLFISNLNHLFSAEFIDELINFN